MANLFSGILSISLGVVMFGSVFMFVVNNQTFCSGWVNGTKGCIGERWSSTEIALWSMLGLVGIGGMAYGVMQVFGLGGQ